MCSSHASLAPCIIIFLLVPPLSCSDRNLVQLACWIAMLDCVHRTTYQQARIV